MMRPDHRPRRTRRRARNRDDPALRRLLARYRQERRRQRTFAAEVDPYGIYVVAAEVSSQRLETLRREILSHLGDSLSSHHAAECAA